MPIKITAGGNQIPPRVMRKLTQYSPSPEYSGPKLVGITLRNAGSGDQANITMILNGLTGNTPFDALEIISNKPDPFADPHADLPTTEDGRFLGGDWRSAAQIRDAQVLARVQAVKRLSNIQANRDRLQRWADRAPYLVYAFLGASIIGSGIYIGHKLSRFEPSRNWQPQHYQDIIDGKSVNIQQGLREKQSDTDEAEPFIAPE